MTRMTVDTGYTTVHTIRLTHDARVAMAQRLSSQWFTKGTENDPVPHPGADGYHHIRLTGHARAIVAAYVAPDGGKPGQVWREGIFTTQDVWDEVAAAFPRSMARDGRACGRELGAAFPLIWFTRWTEDHPDDPDHSMPHHYNPDFGT